MGTIEQNEATEALAAVTPKAWWSRAGLLLLRWGVPLILLVLLGYRLTQIGWIQMWAARPRSFAFYVVLPLIFFAQPVADLAIYRYLWKVGREVSLGVMLRKRYLDNVVLDYSGEAYFYFWAQHRLALPKSLLLNAIKDSNVLSAGAGVSMVFLALGAAVVSGAVRLPSILSQHFWATAAGCGVPVLLCLVLVLGGRKVTSLSRGQIAVTYAIHMARAFSGLVLQFLLWQLSGALPDALAALQFVVLQLLINRLPIIPNKDLIFVGAGLEMAGWLKLSAPPVAAVLVIGTAFDQLFGFALVGLPWLFERRRKAERRAT
jgi:hypothetical protein